MSAADDPRPTGVSIGHVDGHWAVQIVENGEVSRHLFEDEQFASSFAAGQRLLLSGPVVDAGDP